MNEGDDDDDDVTRERAFRRFSTAEMQLVREYLQSAGNLCHNPVLIQRSSFRCCRRCLERWIDDEFQG